MAQRLRAGGGSTRATRSWSSRPSQLIEGCDRAAIGVLDGEEFHSAAATDDVMRLIDGLQDQVGEGPCLEASTDQIVQVDNDITSDCRWPRLAALVLEHTPVRAMLAVPLVDEGQRSGALEHLRRHPEPSTTSRWRGGDPRLVRLGGGTGAGHGARREFEEGMATNREIGAAVGHPDGHPRDQPGRRVRMLSKASQRLNRKLRDIATSIVRGDAVRSPGHGGAARALRRRRATGWCSRYRCDQ